MSPAQIIEAILFVSDSPVTVEMLREYWENEEFESVPLSENALEEILAQMMEKYQSAEYAFELRQIDGGYQFYSKREFFPFVRIATMSRQQKRLGRSALETLSIIAYRQPVTKAELEFIRGVGCDYALTKLLDKKLIDITGRSDAPGRPLLYGTSAYFMEHFGINQLSDLPKLEEFSVDESEYQAHFKNYLTDQSAPKTETQHETTEEE